MGEVCGQYDHSSWITMKQLKQSIDFMRNTDYKKYKTAIDKETYLYKRFIAGDFD